MWISIKAQDGDTLDTIAKRYKNRDPKAILQYDGNKKIAARLKKGEALAKGETVWVLDPKGKVYIVKGPKGEVVLDEKEYKALQKDVHAKMDQFLERQRINYNYAVGRHDAQLKINEDQWFVASVVGTISSVDEPKNGWKVAQAAYKALKKVVNARDYKGFPAAALVCEKEIAKYTNDVHNWIEGLISTAEGTVTVLTGVKEVGKFCGVLAAVTIAAPATLGAAVVVGAASSAGVGLLYDGGENVGLAANGMKTMSAAEIGKRFAANAATGAIAAGILGKLMPMLKGPLVKALTNNTLLRTQAARLAKGLGGRVFMKELEIACEKILPGMTEKGTIHILAIQERVLMEAASKFLVRAGNGLLHKLLQTGKVVRYIEDVLIGWIQSVPAALNDGKSLVDEAVKVIVKSGKVDAIFDDLIDENMDAFRKELRVVLEAHLSKYAKKAA
ncbi:hypothetical protein ACFO5X_21265 [Seohaeicola nanhaiensis]|uniref:LysM domain-containing protein n=1 Tax=Seohaeicola nanhaiensis TaxID=1387282 RepID=A0ABV9KM88_9RHOB